MTRVKINTLVGQAAKLNNIQLLDIAIRNHFPLDGIDSSGRTALMIAAENGFPEICKILVENNADVSIMDSSGKTALDYASSESIVNLLNTAIHASTKHPDEIPTEDSLFSLFDDLEPEEAFVLKDQNSDYLSLIEETQASMLVDNYLEKNEASVDLDVLFLGDTSTLSSYSNYEETMKVVSFGIENSYVSTNMIKWACGAAIGPEHYIDEELLSAMLSAFGILIDDERNAPAESNFEPSDDDLSEANSFLEIEEADYTYWINNKAKEWAAKNRIDDTIEFINNEKLYSELLQLFSQEIALVPLFVCLLKNNSYNPHKAIIAVDQYLNNIQYSETEYMGQENDSDTDAEDDIADGQQSEIEKEIKKRYCHSFNTNFINSSLPKNQLEELLMQLVHADSNKRRYSILQEIKPSLFAFDAILFFLEKYQIDTDIYIEDANHILDIIQTKNYQIAFKNYGLIEFSLRSVYTHGLDRNDLKQEGFWGLLRAIERFSFRNGASFATYSVFYIKQAMFRYIQNNSTIIRYPVHIQEKKHYYERCCREYSCRDDILNDCANKFETSPEEFYSRYASNFYVEESYEESVMLDPEKWNNLCSCFEDELLDKLNNLYTQNILQKILATLPPREQEVIKIRYGLEDEPKTLEEVGKIFGVTRERIRQIEAKAINRLKNPKRSKQLLSCY